MAADPTYPLYPIACILTAAMLFLVLLTNFIRQSWNLGVALLCFWLFLENLTGGIDAVIWSNNADIKLYVYCDIVSHVQMITSVAKPMATLVITRRLYLITSLRSIESPKQAARRRDIATEWMLGLGIPLLVGGPLYYVVQYSRFAVEEGFGCLNSIDGSILSILLINSWNLILPLVSITVYYPQTFRIFYRQSREVNHFLQSNTSVSRTNYFRVLALASIDILLTMPVGIATVVLAVEDSLALGPIPFYFGWTYDHTGPGWQPESYSYAEMVSDGTFNVANIYFTRWTSPVLAFAIFGLFGVTPEARASYWHIICKVGGWFGWKPTPRARRARSSLGDMEFGEMPPQNSMSLGLDTHPSFINDARSQGQVVQGGVTGSETGNGIADDANGGIRPATGEAIEYPDAERPPRPSASHETGLGDASARA
ncbi:unnamed protein product [Peniophora sp. CBMAI 1063]|nr:unnamed protein product [Peniophora sp. CBMAI 1063]